MFEKVMEFAKANDKIRVVGMEGSRVNKNVTADSFQDYDITYIVTDMDCFISDDRWLNIFGKRLIMQKPEDMVLFSPELGGWYSYLMIFENGEKLDLTIVPLSELKKYLNHDKLIKILLDKDGLIDIYPVASDIDYHIKKPCAREYDDCQNEFWFVSTYVSKGLCRNEYLFAVKHYTEILHKELLRMISWSVGIKTGFSLSVGKANKYLDKYLDKETWKKIEKSLDLSSKEKVWKSLFISHDLMQEYSQKVAKDLNYTYPDYAKKISRYTEDLYKTYCEN